MSLAEQILGRGPGFPLLPDDQRGHLPLRSGAEKVRESIELILRTEPGERLMRPTFGCPLRQFLMEPNTVAVRARLQAAVRRALETWEPRIVLRDVRATPTQDPAVVQLTIRYDHRVDRSEGLLVYPFSLEA